MTVAQRCCQPRWAWSPSLDFQVRQLLAAERGVGSTIGMADQTCLVLGLSMHGGEATLPVPAPVPAFSRLISM
jgi:hypothetical protein